MTDQDLIKTVAEILGLNHSADGSHIHYKGFMLDPLARTVEAKAFCWEIATKNKIRPDYFKCRDGSGSEYYAYYADFDDGAQSTQFTDAPQRAVLLAFVELNKEK